MKQIIHKMFNYIKTLYLTDYTKEARRPDLGTLVSGSAAVRTMGSHRNNGEDFQRGLKDLL